LIQRTLDQDLRRSEVWDHWFAYSSRLGTTLRLCDGAITTNEYLADRIREFACVPVTVAPNFMNREQLEISESIFATRRSLEIGGDPIRLGYFSGSPSHNRDFAIVAPALEVLLDEDPRLGLVVAGHIDAGAALGRFGARVQQYPFQDFINLQRLIASVDFNLVPLQYNTFTNCKSELKYFEAAIVGTQTIASPTYAYARAIRHGENGYLAQAHQWVDRVRTAVAGMADYGAMAECSYEDACTKYAWFNQRDCILDALTLA
jgi:glycosyltransferase involved in cell wall biosynthesis